MSYRAFKRLLGETSLERKCRFLFGGFILLLISGSFWLYARQTEHLAYDQLKTTCRLLVVQTVDRQLATGCRPVGEKGHVAPDQNQRAAAMAEFRSKWEENWPEALQRDKTWTFKADVTRAPGLVPDQATRVKIRKDVSDAISAGELNVRSEIQTGDEFEDFSHAFNRMLRNLVAMQDRLRKVNNDLDKKVDELAQANLALYEMNSVKSEFLATISHELRTPLHSILAFTAFLGPS